MPGELEKEIREMLERMLTGRGEQDADLKADLRDLKGDIKTMGTQITGLVARDESIAEMRATQTRLRDDVTKLKAQMAIGGVVSAAVLVAVITLVFSVFGGGGAG